MSIEKLRPTFTFTEDRLRELAVIVPEAFADGKINWDTLQEALGAYLEEEEQEHFGLTWPGKREARRLAAMPSKGTLIPQPGEGINEDTTRNIFIEGDNLEVLKLLQKSYAGRVKLIYIDPPYNTGNDFIYPDDYSEPLDAYLQRTGQVDDVGQKLTTNTRASGRFHSNWLSMIYPRLLLARQLLTKDGIIFVSIDNNEFHNLVQIMNEIFGEENQVECLVWKKAYGGGAKAKHVVGLHEYILCYAREKDAIGRIELPANPETRKYYKSNDEKYETRGPYRTQPLWTNSMDPRPNLRYAIQYEGEVIWPEKQWQWSEERVKKAQENNELVFVKSDDGWSVYYKQYLYDENGIERGAKPYSILEGPYTQKGTAELEKLFGDGKVFPFPKPSELVSHLLSYGYTDKNAIIMDFFAGSCSTAQSVLEMNNADESKRQFILVQLPEPTDHPDYLSIAEIGKERVRRVISNLENEKDGKLNLFPDEDLGFKCFQLDQSNYKEWRPYTGREPQQLETLFDHFETPLVEGWKPENLITEILLLQGFPLASRIVLLEAIQSNVIQRSYAEGIGHELFVCLDGKVSDETIGQLHLRSEDIFVCLDSALSDEAKIRLADQCNLKVI